MPDSVMLNSYFMLYLIPLYHFPLYLIPDCPLERYNRFLFSVIPDSIMPDSVIPDSCFDIPDSVIPNSIIPDSCFACYNRFRYTRFPAPNHSSEHLSIQVQVFHAIVGGIRSLENIPHSFLLQNKMWNPCSGSDSAVKFVGVWEQN